MASVLEIDPLLAPLPGDNPAGESLPFELRARLEDMRITREGEDVPPEEVKKADWPAIISLAQETLTQTSKDLLVAARLTEALVKQNGFAGLRDGLRLLRSLVEQCWDRVNPPIEDGDVEIRGGPFHWLDDPDRGARFPSSLRMVPVVSGESGDFSWIDWRESQDGKGTVTREEFEKAIQMTAPERCQAQAEEVVQSVDELNKLTKALSAKMGPEAPALSGIRQALEDCQKLVQQIAAMRRPEAAGKTDISSGQAVGGGAAAPSGGGLPSRQEAYRQLEHAANVLRQLEPHSPIPYLVQRAVELGRLPFPQLIKALIRDANVLSELNRELGVKEKEAPGGES
jgi:type VI secretion system protein ImpA